MKRREFISLLGGAAVAWPLAARAQQAGRLPTIGFLGASTRSAENQWIVAFVQRLRELGWIEGRTGNVTGVSFYNTGAVTKRFEVARELVTKGTPIGMLVNPANPPSVSEGMAVQKAAAAIRQPLQLLHASTQAQIDDVFAAVEQKRIGALIISSDPFFFIERVKLVVLMARLALPTVFPDREQADAGGLMSYGASRPDAYRQAGNYVGRIVKGEKPSELPVVLPTKFHLLINLKTAKSLRIDIPATLLARADEVIE